MATDLVTAGAILGIGRTTAHALARDGRFPVPVLRVGRRDPAGHLDSSLARPEASVESEIADEGTSPG